MTRKLSRTGTDRCPDIRTGLVGDQKFKQDRYRQVPRHKGRACKDRCPATRAGLVQTGCPEIKMGLLQTSALTLGQGWYRQVSDIRTGLVQTGVQTLGQD